MHQVFPMTSPATCKMSLPSHSRLKLKVFIPECTSHIKDKGNELYDNSENFSYSLALLSPKQMEVYAVNLYGHRTVTLQVFKQIKNKFKKHLDKTGYELIVCCSTTSSDIKDINNVGTSFALDIIFTVYGEHNSYPNILLNDKLSNRFGEVGTLLIVYDCQTLKLSSYLCDQAVENEIAHHLLECEEILEHISDSVSSSKDNGKITFHLKKKKTQVNKNQYWTNLAWLYGAVFNIFKLFRFPQTSVYKRLCAIPAVCEQIRRKYDDCACTLKLDNNCQKGIHRLRLNNMFMRNVLDIVAGVCIMLWFMSNTSYSNLMAENMMSSAQLTATELQKLLRWMMGVPAGLKLNSQLDLFLGKFFLYHIYLWTAYLNILKPVLASALWYISLAGCLGLSVQLALLQDMLSMMTLHIYCFYVYAARLYNLQMSGLSSLWHLFRGKKWNGLRQRLDSAQYDIDQLFVGTLLFTVLLFLLPTTALYYVVFLTLRLLVLSLQWLVYKLISIINNLPVYFLMLRVFSPQTVTNDIEFEVVTEGKGYLKMKLKTASIGQLLHDGRMQGVENQSYSWADILQKMYSGCLIYPWLDK